MKSIIKYLILGTGLLSPLFTYAQTNEEISIKKITYGIKTGASLSSVLAKGQEFFEGKKIGFVLGGFVRYRINESTILQSELLFVRKGNETERTYFGGEIGSDGSSVSYIVSSDHKLSYLSVPINIYTDLSKKLKIFYGVEPSFLCSEKYIMTIDEEKVNTNNLEGRVKKVDLGLNLGLNYVMSNTLNLDLKFNQGIIKLNKEGPKNFYNSSVQLTLGYALN